jgi:hypothetical protein
LNNQKNKSEKMLPQVDLPYQPDFHDISKEYDARDVMEDSYQKLQKVIQYFLEGDCCALTDAEYGLNGSISQSLYS